MKITDYSKIASKYDDNKLRHSIDVDTNIATIINENANKPITILDLACGTGNYLVKQREAYKNYSIQWIGLDKSSDMLNIAKQKHLDAELILGDACNLPLKDESIDYIKIRFAFHHFLDKKQALKEVCRVLKKNGAVSIHNLSHDYMQNSWVYKYYPQVREIDNNRFPPTLDIFRGLDDLGFYTQATINTIIKKFNYKDILAEVRNRDMSQLNLISDEEYQAGLNQIISASTTNEYLLADISFMDLLGKKVQ